MFLIQTVACTAASLPLARGQYQARTDALFSAPVVLMYFLRLRTLR
jgi:hypothetical protein